MVAPLVAAAGISAGGALLGGLLSDRSARSTASKQRQMDIEFAKNQIAWKVADAKRAGIHPLYALGASGSYAPTNIIQGQSNTGSALGKASSQIADMYLQSATQKQAAKTQAPLLASQVNAANQSANRDAAQAALALSQAKRVEQEINATALGRDLPPTHIRARDPVTGELTWVNNPELNLETSEIVGTAKYLDANFKDIYAKTPQGRAAALGSKLNKRIRQWYRENTYNRKGRRSGRNRRNR